MTAVRELPALEANRELVVPPTIERETLSRLDGPLRDVVVRFRTRYR